LAACGSSIVLLACLIQVNGCGGGSAAAPAGPQAPQFNGPQADAPADPDTPDAPVSPEPPDTAETPAVPVEDLPLTQRLLSAIPLETAGFSSPFSGELPAGPFNDGIDIAGGACRYWIDDTRHQLFLAFILDFGTAAAAEAKLAELRPAGAEDVADLAHGGNCGEHAWTNGERGFILASFHQGSFIGFTGAAVLDAGASAPDKEAVLDLARELSAALAAIPAHGASSAVKVPQANFDTALPLTAPRVASLTFLKEITVPLKIGGKNNGSISFKLEITPTDSQCGHWENPAPGQSSGPVGSCSDLSGPPAYCHIVDVFISRISLGDEDGDGAGRGAGDLMAGGEVSIYFKRGTKSTKQTLSFASTELGDCDANDSLGSLDNPGILPKFIQKLEGCGQPSAVDFDVLVRDNDEGADVLDVVEVLIVGAAEAGIGKNTGGSTKELMDELEKRHNDETGTDGMRKLRERDGDDVGEAHDKQIPLLAE
jgi:hypothetical protein